MLNQPLVSQYLEKISGTALDKYQQVIRGYVRRRNGIYALYRRDRLYYVGLTKNLRNRLKSHLKDKHQGKWDRFSVYLTVGDAHLRELESLVLRISEPKGNSQRGRFGRARHGRFGRAQDLKRSLKRDIITQHKHELEIDLGTKKRDIGKSKSGSGDGGTHSLVRLFPKRIVLKGAYKKKTYKALLLLNGKISFRGKRYDTPANAARVARGRRSNGWWFWKYERAPGDWVRLRELRRR